MVLNIFEEEKLSSGVIALLVITAMGCGMQNLCRRRDSEDDDETSSLGYSVAVSNSMFREERYFISNKFSMISVNYIQFLITLQYTEQK